MRRVPVLLLAAFAACSGKPRGEETAPVPAAPVPAAPVPAAPVSAAPAQSLPADDRADLTLFLPAAARAEIHAQALRLDVADSAVLAAAFIAARGSLASSPVTPRLTPGPSARVYFYVSRRLQDEAAAAATASGRSQSWVFLKAWEMRRAEIAVLENADQLHAWVRGMRRGPR
jgi:hypothetical protein